ncbi:MAG: insulinase family protein [Sphingobium sp.]|nr:insulinase family protein [Sphingobium sp.]
MRILDAGRRLFTALTAIALLLPGPAAAAPAPAPKGKPAVQKPAAKPVAKQIAAKTVASAPAAAPRPAEAAAPAAPRPWFYEHSDVPMDTAWQFGMLPNGLRYAVRRNDIPARMVSIRVRMDVGSLMEKPEEAGFAHFIEHLSFRGSRDAPDGESKRIWQRLGAEFGVDTNAETSPIATTFAVDLPETNAAGLDESLKILASMVSAPNIVPQAVDAERSIVMAERRESLSPALQLEDQARAFYYAGQPLGRHNPIGTEATLSGATAETLRAFHDRWYRPDRTVVAISGDADPAMLIELVKKRFGSWQGIGATPPLPDFGRPDPQAPATKVVKSPDTPVSIRLVYLRPWVFHDDTIAFNQARIVDDLALQLINRRLAVAATGSASFIEASVVRDDSYRSVSATYVNIVPVGDDWEKALREVRAIVEDARRTPPSKADIDREFVVIENALAQQVATSRIEASTQQVDNLVSALDIRETVVAPGANLDIYRGSRSLMTPENVRDSTRRMFTGTATRVLLSVKGEQPTTLARLGAAFRAPVEPARNVRLSNKAVTMASLPALPAPGKIALDQPLGALGIDQIVFENGVTLFLHANKTEPGKVHVNVRFGHGQQSFSPDENAALWAAPATLMASGIGNLDSNALEELMNGRQLALQFRIEEDAFTMSAVSSPKDYPDQLRLFASKLAFPRWDAATLARTVNVLNVTYDPVPNSAGAAIQRNVGWLLRDKDARVAPPTPADAQQLTLEKFKEVWEPRLANGPIEIQVYGDINRDEAVAAVAASFGALPRRPDMIPPPENRVRRFPAQVAQPIVLKHNGTPEQAGAIIAWPTGGGEDRIRESRQLEMLARIINDRLFEKLRSVDGAAYTPSASSDWPESYETGGYLIVQTQLKPERIPYFFNFVDEVVADLAAKPVSADELAREVEPVRKYLGLVRSSIPFWMGQLGGLSRDPRKLAMARTLQDDVLSVTAADIQALAQRYLRSDTRWSAVVLADGVQPPALPVSPRIADLATAPRVAASESSAAQAN